MPEPFTRRDFLNATLLASGGALLGAASPLELLAARDVDFDGYGAIGDYALANGNTLAVLKEGHRIRDRVYGRVPPREIADAGSFDCVVVGGGISGLAAGLFFSRQTKGKRSCLVLEDHSIFGGLARRNEFEVDGQHLVASQASAMILPPLPGTFLADFYPSIGIEASTFEYQKWTGAKRELPVGKDGQPAPGEVLRGNPVGRVAFANSDVSGIMDHRASILEADRAVRQVLERL